MGLRNKQRIKLTIFLGFLMVLVACAPAGDQDSGVTTLVYANLTKGGVDRAAVNRFNTAHAGEIRIEVQDYFTEDGDSGKKRLLAELSAGNIPDILDLRGMPYQMLAQKGYLENLWPFIEKDPELGRKGVVEAPLKAAEVDGGLYTVFGEVYINTLVGAASVTGKRYSWSLTELLDAFSGMPEESTILRHTFDKETAFYYVLRMQLENYIDWETGLCTFDSENFRSSLEFVNSFPQEFEWTDVDVYENAVEITNRILTGRQMLDQYSFGRLIDIQYLDAIYGLGGTAAFIGYPIEDGSAGSSFYLPYKERKLGMSAACKEKNAAWEFLREILLPRYADKADSWLLKSRLGTICINREDYERMVRFDMSSQNAAQMSRGLLGGPTIQYRAATEEERARYEDFIDNIDKIEIFDNTVYDIVLEQAGPYFAGDKTLDATVDLIQRRVSLYVNEVR